jgi:hypothetical protein
MFSGFIKGIVGGLLGLVAAIVFFAMLTNGAGFGAAVIVAGVIEVFGAYLSYVSRQTVRTRP